MKKSVSVSNLTLNLWLDFVRPALRAVNMLEEVPAKDEWHEFTAEMIEEATAEEIAHFMTVACFNAHGNNEFASIEEAKQMVYQLEASMKYHSATAEALATLREALAAKIAEATFPKLTEAVNTHFDTVEKNFSEKLETVTTGEALEGWYYRNRMTAAALRMAKEADPADPLPEKVREKMVYRFHRENESDRQKYLHKLDRAATAPAIEDMTVCVEWARNRTWGKTPTATATVNNSDHFETRGSASGCGYDKQSAAIANALNANAAVLRVLYTHAENGGKFAYSVYMFAGLPYFDGGCGVSCFRNVFEGCGYEWRDLVHRSMFDSYRLTPSNA